MKLRAPRRAILAAVAFGLLVALALLALAAFPFDRARPRIEAMLSRRLGVPVRIAHIRRLDSLSFAPELAVEGVTIPQPAWAGTGDLLTLRAARFRLPVLPLLIGRFRPGAMRIDGMRLALVRAADGRENWREGSGGSGSGVAADALTISDSRVTYVDGKRPRRFDVGLTIDPALGMTIAGTGSIDGALVRISARGAPIGKANAPWPFSARIDGPTLSMRADGTMDRPLDPRTMRFDSHVRADDLSILEPVIDTGLFGTQPLDVAAHVERDGKVWRLTALVGNVGRSRIDGSLTVDKRTGRTRLDGAVHANPFDFDDLASRHGLAEAAALKRRIGKRLVPPTRIDLTHLAHTDGTLRVEAQHLIGGGSPPIASLAATLTLDHSLLTAAPLHLGLVRGAIDGEARVDQRGRMIPQLTIALNLSRASLAELGGSGIDLDGRVWGDVRLTGPGVTIREAVGRSHGTVALFARDGSLPARLASLLGLDLGHALTAGPDRRSGLRCAELRLAVKGGIGTVTPLVVDTTRAQSRGTGTINLADERIAISLTGAPKKDSLLRLPGALSLDGTLSEPHAALPPETRSAGTIFKVLKRVLRGPAPLATDLDCARLG